MVNKQCVTRKRVLGDKNLLLSLQSPCSKEKQAVGLAKKEGKKKKNLNFNSATIVKKPESYIQPAPEEQRKPVNLRGIPDDDLFGPSFLYQKPEVWTEKKTTSANPIGVKPKMKYTPQSESEIEFSSSEIDDEIQCMICRKGIPADEEQEHINAEH